MLTPGPPATGGAQAGRPRRAVAWLARGMWTGALVGVLAGAALTFALLPPAGTPGAVPVLVSVDEGLTAREIGRELEQAGIVRSDLVFSWLARLRGLDGELRAGEYRLWSDMSLPEVVNTLRAGRVVTRAVTVPEGSTIDEIARILGESGITDPAEFRRLSQDDRLVYGSAPPIPKPVRSLEGYLFPDTYRFARDVPAALVVRTMVARFLAVVPPLVEAASSDLTLHQVVTLASIVEREAALDSERPLIASVFLNRLAQGMPLQSDPTVQYALGEWRPLSYPDLALDSPYNTYRYRGLPPGPIASPGIASIRAVLFPARSGYLYFVARGDGSHHFSRTFQEHVRARRRYR